MRIPASSPKLPLDEIVVFDSHHCSLNTIRLCCLQIKFNPPLQTKTAQAQPKEDALESFHDEGWIDFLLEHLQVQHTILDDQLVCQVSSLPFKAYISLTVKVSTWALDSWYLGPTDHLISIMFKKLRRLRLWFNISPKKIMGFFVENGWNTR